MKKILSLTCLCLIVICAKAARIVDGINYEFDRTNMTCTVVKYDNYTSYTGSIVIPSTITVGGDTYTVTSIGKYAFENTDITSISLPNTLVEIQDYAFEDCHYLTKLSLPDAIKTIGKRAFRNCKGITSLKLPNNDVELGEYSFYCLKSLVELTIPEKWTQIGSENSTCVFNDCTSLKKLTIGKKVTNIWGGAFADCSSLSEVVCYEDGALSYIGSSAFAGCISLTSMRFLPRTVKTLGSGAFARCNGLIEVFIPSNVEIIYGGFWEIQTTKLVIEDSNIPLMQKGSGRSLLYPTEVYLGRPLDKDLSSGVPFYKNDLKKVTFGPLFNGGNEWQFGKLVTEIYSYVKDPSAITCEFDVNVYDNATLYVPVGTKAAYKAQYNFAPFFDIREFTPGDDTSDNIVFADPNVKAICVANWDTNGDGELSRNEAAKVTDIGTVFSFNKEIKSFDELQFFTGLKSICDFAFYYCTGLKSITFPNSIKDIGAGAFQYCIALTSVTIPNSVTSINTQAFEDCSGLTSVSIPDRLTYLGYYAFHNCSNLTTIMIPNGVTKICEGTFDGCSGLTSFTIHNNITSIGRIAFLGCSGLKSVTIPNSVTTIGEEAFENCSSLTSVTLSNSLTTIEYGTFACCSRLESVIIPNSVTNIGDNAFQDCKQLWSVTIPNSVKSIGKYAFMNCNLLFSVTIPNSVTSIGRGAFEGCRSLCQVTIGNSVTKIEDNTFMNCTELQNVTIPNSVISLGNRVFMGCNYLETITIPNSVKNIGYEIVSICHRLKDVFCYAETVPLTENNAFNNSSISNATLHVPAASVNLYKTTEPWTQFGSIISLTGDGPEPTEFISFADANVNSISISNWDTNGDGKLSREEAAAVETLNGAFKENTEIKTFEELQYFTGLTYIGFMDFYGCTNLTKVSIPDGVGHIFSSAFFGCTSLISITIGNSVTEIQSSSFGNCINLTTIVIGNSSDLLIGNRAFGNCNKISHFYCYAETLPIVNQAGMYVFEGSSIGEATLHVPASSLQVYKNTSPWKNFNNIVALTDSDPKPTGINTQTISGNAGADCYYSIGGQRARTPRKGLNIVRMSNGITKKVMIK